MNILIITRSLSTSDGQGRYATDLIKMILPVHKVTVLSPDIKVVDESIKEKIRIVKIPEWRGRFKWFLFFEYFFILRQYLSWCDAIHALDVYPFGIVASLVNFRRKKKLILTLIGTYSIMPFNKKIIGFWSRWSIKKTDKIFAIRRFTRDQTAPLIAAKIEVINPGLDFEKFHRVRIASQEKFILSVGKLKKRKGGHITIAAFAEAKKKIKDLKCVMVGNQEDQKYFFELKNLVGKLGLTDDVKFLNRISDQELSSLYSRAKIFIMPSINHKDNFEGFGLVFLEAAAAGLPVIGTSGNGIEDAISQNGVLVSQNNVNQTAEAIEKILASESVWHDYSQKSYLWAKEHDLKAMAKYYLAIYEG